MAETETDLLRSSLDLLILKALMWGPQHGYGVVAWIEQATGSAVLLVEGTLYPALHRLERKGWLEHEWGISSNNRKAKFYRLTTTGRAQLQRETPVWLQHAEALARALRATSPLTAS